MNRRELLGALAGGVVAVSGCIDGPGGAGADTASPAGGDTDPPAGGGTPTVPPTDTDRRTVPSTDDGTPAPPDREGSPTTDPPGAGETATADFLRELFVVPELVAPNSPDSFGVWGDRDEQYVVAALDGQGGAPPVADIALAVDGDSYSVETEVGYGSWALFDYAGAYHPADEPRGWVVVPLPNPLDADEVTLSWPGGKAALPESERAELARPPTTFEVESFDAPTAVDEGERIEATLTVANTGDTDGVFVAAVNRSGPRVAYAPEGAVRLPVPAGETRTFTYEHTVEWEEMSTERPMRVHVNWRDDSLNREIVVRPHVTTTVAE